MPSTPRLFLDIPEDKNVLAALGRIAVRHGQLDHLFRLTVKTILNISITEALDATDGFSSRDLRKRVRQLAKQKLGEGDALVRLDALLSRASRATGKRNDILHSVVAYDEHGNPYVKDDDHQWKPHPNATELQAVADELAAVASDLNKARFLDGFLATALQARQNTTGSNTGGQ